MMFLSISFKIFKSVEWSKGVAGKSTLDSQYRFEDNDKMRTIIKNTIFNMIKNHNRDKDLSLLASDIGDFIDGDVKVIDFEIGQHTYCLSK